VFSKGGLVFQSPGSSDFDLNFRLLGFPIQVSPSFWLMAIILGWRYVARSGGLAEGWFPLATWVGVVFISLLVHELGHALAGRWLGHRPFIHLSFFGGAAYSGVEFGWRQVFVVAAGPAAGWSLYLLCRYLVLSGYLPLSETVLQFLEVNFFWTIFNLMPVYPLDGGQILQGLTQATVPRWSISITHTIGAIAAALLAIYGFRVGAPLMTVMFGLFCMQNIQILQGRQRW